jgi:hypothetical protein
MAAEMASEPRRLAALHLEHDLSVPAAFDSSCGALGPDAARMYRLASLLPAAEFSAELAAAATGTGPRQAAGLLDTLVDAGLLEEPACQRYRFHPLVRLHAREHVDARSADERRAALATSADWCRHAAAVADLAVIPDRSRPGSLDAFPSPACRPGWQALPQRATGGLLPGNTSMADLAMRMLCLPVPAPPSADAVCAMNCDACVNSAAWPSSRSRSRPVVTGLPPP